ncbi:MULTISPECIES: hypothetical protein [Priestia]|uniref:hypothetical protein n=1 Tax=Priestia TaxID=2800373 RepID=UPI0012B9F87E|nr:MULTISPECIES: hypothetical protein [Priestia]MED3946599.1 hypothetical protein [Priestia aryabhattai]
MYQNSYPYGYYYPYYDYTGEMYNFRNFASQIGDFYTILHDLSLGSGITLRSGTRVFIHSVRYDAGGNEIVTIVFPHNCIVRKTDVLGSKLEEPAPVYQYRHDISPRSLG